MRTFLSFPLAVVRECSAAATFQLQFRRLAYYSATSFSYLSLEPPLITSFTAFNDKLQLAALYGKPSAAWRMNLRYSGCLDNIFRCKITKKNLFQLL